MAVTSSPSSPTTAPAVTLRAGDGSSVRIDRFPVVLGRHHPNAATQPDCDLSALDSGGSVSRRHLELAWGDGALLVTDLGSTNGSRLDGQPLTPHQPVMAPSPAAELVLGELVLTLEVEAPPPDPAASGVGAAPAPTNGVDMHAALDAFVNGVFRAFQDPAVTQLVVEERRKVRMRREGQWVQAGTREVSPEAWWALWMAFCQSARLDPGSTGYVSTLLNDAVMVEAVLPPVAVTPVFIAEKRPAPLGLDGMVAANMLDAEGAAALRTAILAHQGILVAGPRASGRTTLIEALVDAIPRGERVVVVERRPAIRYTSPKAVRLRTPGDQGESAVAAAIALTPEWIVVDDAEPDAVVAAVRRLEGSAAVILGPRTADAEMWRNRAAAGLLPGAGDLATARAEVDRLLSVTVQLAVSDERLRLAGIDRP